MRSTLSDVTTSADMRCSSWAMRSSLPSLKASKARMKPSKAVPRSSGEADLVSMAVGMRFPLLG